jgi:23S rRNA pseudouridine1911/1915/1917 synthase
MPKKEVIEILHQDSDIIVINKPTGLSVTKDRSHYEELLPSLRKQLKLSDSEKLLLVHRLDKETSGVMILARNTAAQRQFTGFFTKGLIKKTYLALVSAAIMQDEGTIDAPIGNDRKNPRRMCIDTSKRGRKAITNWQLLADFGGIALLAVSPITGRTHQIRVHLPSAGMPLAIDPLYGSREPIMLSRFKAEYNLGKWQEEKPLIERLTLHAYQVQLPQPVTTFAAKLDKKFAATLKMLTKHNARGPAAFRNPDLLAAILAGRPIA